VQQIPLNRADLAIFIIYMFLAVGLGFLVSLGRRKRPRVFSGGKTLPWYVIASSMLAATSPASTSLPTRGSGIANGIVAATASWNCWIIYTIFIWIFLPYYVRTNLYTIPQFLERRYNSVCRYIFSASLVVGYVAAIIAGSLYAGGLAFERMIGPFLGGTCWVIPTSRSSRGSSFSRW
jgi:SSS family solute:Na+ symporter